METPPGPVRHADDGTVGPVEIARVLGVSQQRVHTWATRRARNGFPLPDAYEWRRGRWEPRYVPSKVVEWWSTYRPGRGGAPHGSRAGRRTTTTRRVA